MGVGANNATATTTTASTSTHPTPLSIARQVSVGWKSSSTNTLVPSIITTEMDEILRCAVSETGISEVQMIENGGRSVAQFVCQAIGGARRLASKNIRANGAPSVMVLVGNCLKGAFGLCAARHLSQRGVDVSVLVLHNAAACASHSPQQQSQKHAHSPHGQQLLITSVAWQFRCFQSTSGHIISSALDLPSVRQTPMDLIIDTLMDDSSAPFQCINEFDSDAAIAVGRVHHQCEAIHWANISRAPKVSLDVPSGVDASSGKLLFGNRSSTVFDLRAVFSLPRVSACCNNRSALDHVVVPNYILVLALPKLALVMNRLERRRSAIYSGTSPLITTGTTPPNPELMWKSCDEIHLMDLGIPASIISHVVNNGNRTSSRSEGFHCDHIVDGCVDSSTSILSVASYEPSFADKWMIELEFVEQENHMQHSS